MNIRALSLGILILAFSASAADGRRCDLKSTAKITDIELLAAKHRLSEAQLGERLQEAYDDEASEVIACLNLRKWKGIPSAIIQRVQLTWEGNCDRLIKGLESASEYAGSEDAELLAKIENAKANCAWTHDLLSRALHRVEIHGDSAWDERLMLNESQAMAF